MAAGRVKVRNHAWFKRLSSAIRSTMLFQVERSNVTRAYPRAEDVLKPGENVKGTDFVYRGRETATRDGQ
ncbi:hypothetical protein O1611_g10598 [Lasiodiplodia mahajangana]|uniref:Uncharacterized protein n=1 Tax=Lasiodiplodia mahajangana TaxID=1108764 RepID=A0ACC2IWA7_9PEZI|nr:hypothetical protein O1611_g10598 [Lasiodiplodia mahajangana]